jgi:ubiquinone/menaquinone biosynthesis methyltransferase
MPISPAPRRATQTDPPVPEAARSQLVPQLAARADKADAHAIAVRSMFDRISPTYDLLNRLLSFGIDQRWRARALRELAHGLPEGTLLDVCAGTLDLSLALRRRWPARRMISLDFAREMLISGRSKVPDTLRVVGDAMCLPIADGSVAGFICGFGMRNLSDPSAGLREAARVLKPAGVCVVLEFFRPESVATRLFHAFYARLLLPLVGRLVSGDGEAYGYLSRSMEGFMARREFEQAMRDAGFARVQAWDLTFGIASIVRGVREVPGVPVAGMHKPGEGA